MDIITFTDENGNEVEFEVLSVAEYEGDNYLLVTDFLEEDSEGEEIPVYIMREDAVEGDDAYYVMLNPEEEDEEFMDRLMEILEDNIPEEDYDDEEDFE